jgi:acyl dehydratase
VQILRSNFSHSNVQEGNNEVTIRYLEDFSAGQIFRSRSLQVDKKQIIAFAAEFDPQPFHLDEVAAQGTIFGGLAASGWHTTALTIRLILASDLNPAGGVVGAGVEELRWPRPVRPGDELYVECEILDVRTSRSRPECGLVKVKTTTFTQKDEAVLCFVGNLVVQCRPQ